MKNLIEKFKSLPIPLRLMIIIGLLWAYPFIYAGSIGAKGWYDLNILAIILMGLSILPFGYLVWLFGIKPLKVWLFDSLRRILK